MSSSTIWVAPDLLKALAILSVTIVRRPAVDQGNLKPYWKLEKWPHFSNGLTILLFTTFSKTLVFSCRPFSNTLKYRDHRWDLPTIWKTRFRHTLKSSASLYESSGSQFFRTTTGIQSLPDFILISLWEVIDPFVLVAYASLADWRTLLHRLLACTNFTLDSEDLFYWYKGKKWFLWTMAAVQAVENHGDEWGLI